MILRDCLHAIFGDTYLVPHFFYDGSQNQTIRFIIIRDQYIQWHVNHECLPVPLLYGEELLKIRDRQNFFNILVALGNAHIGTVTAGVVAQQQQHAQGGAVQVGGAAHVDDVVFHTVFGFFVGVSKLLVGTEVETALHLYGEFITIH